MPTESAQLHVDDPEFGDLVFDAVVAGAEDGEPVLLLHGWPQTALSWSRVIPPLASSGLRIAAVDQRGYSEGARPSEVAAYATDRLVGDAADLLDALGWGTAHVVGHDWGAIVGWSLAARHPGLVRSLTAISAPHPRAFASAIRGDEVQREKSAYLAFFRHEPAKAAKVLLREDATALRLVYADAVHEHDVEAYVDFFAHDDAMEASLRWYAAMDDAALLETPVVRCRRRSSGAPTTSRSARPRPTAAASGAAVSTTSACSRDGGTGCPTRTRTPSSTRSSLGWAEPCR